MNVLPIGLVCLQMQAQYERLRADACAAEERLRYKKPHQGSQRTAPESTVFEVQRALDAMQHSYSAMQVVMRLFTL